MRTVSLLFDAQRSPAAAERAAIRATRQTEFVNNFWRARGAFQEVPGDE